MTRNTAKKGITAVVAIVLLLMMTIAAAALAYSWISQMQKGQQAAGTAQVEKVTQNTQFSYSIDSVRGAAGNIVVDIRNTGTNTMSDIGGTNAKLYVNGIPQATVMGLTGVITEGASASFTTTIAMPAIGTTKDVKLVTPEANTIEFSCKATSATACSGY